MYNLDDIKKVLPHRDPFLFLDKITNISDDRNIIEAQYTFKEDLDIFKGHFPTKPIVPGVILLESMAQAGAFLVLSLDEYKGKLALFAGADSVKWRNPVLPNDTVVLKVEVKKFRHGVGLAEAYAYVNGNIACEAIIKVVVR